MSRALEPQTAAAVFFALGDPTRLSLLARLSLGPALSATQLAQGAGVTRQAITKHLAVLEDAGLVVSTRHGRDVLYVLEAARVDAARAFLDGVSQGWDRAIARLQRLVEDGEDDDG